MSDFETHLKEAVGGEKPEVLGVVALAVDRGGKMIRSYAAGRTHLSAPQAHSINSTTAVFPLASATKLITAIALLRLLQRDPSLSLDDPNLLSAHLPELTSQPIITSPPGAPLAFAPRSKPLTLRHLLTHTSGSGADFLDPRLAAWRKARGENPMYLSAALPAAIATPLLFPPGEAWVYGAGSDWLGLFIARVAGEPLSAFVRREVCDVVGCDARIGFSRRDVEDAGGAVVQVVTRGKGGGGLEEHGVPEQASERGGGGMFSSADNFARILADVVAGESRLLTGEMLGVLFEPQLEEGGGALESLRAQSHVFKGMTGALTAGLPATAVNHALGGMLITEDSAALGRSAKTMAWGGAFGSMWFANREKGLAAFYGGCSFPPGQGKNAELMGMFVEEVWRAVDV